MAKATPAPPELNVSDLISSTDAGEILGRRIEPYTRNGRITPVMRVGTGIRSPLLFRRADVIRLAAELSE